MEVHEFYRDGRPCRKEYYENGKLEGKREHWYETGKLWVQDFWREDILEGERKVWFSDGVLSEYGYFKRGSEVYQYFTIEKKLVFLKLKRFLRFRAKLSNIDSFLISDLEKIVI